MHHGSWPLPHGQERAPAPGPTWGMSHEPWTMKYRAINEWKLLSCEKKRHYVSWCEQYLSTQKIHPTTMSTILWNRKNRVGESHLHSLIFLCRTSSCFRAAMSSSCFCFAAFCTPTPQQGQNVVRMLARGGLVQGLESVCWGVGDTTVSKLRGLSVSWFLGFLLSRFLGFLVSSLLGFLVPRFLRFVVPSFLRFFVSKFQGLKNACQVFAKLFVHIRYRI